MKVSNNALNFLLAQYRAIFKRAYIKGLASAVLLTAGLAAGSTVSAAALDDATKLAESGTITINSGETYDSVTIAPDGDVISGAWQADLVVASGALTANSIKASGGNAVTLGGAGSNGSLVINLDSSIDSGLDTNGLSITGNAETKAVDLTIDIKSIDVTRGALKMATGASGSVTVAADTIEVGDSAAQDVTAGTHNGNLVIESTTATYTATLGDASSNITVYSDGLLSLKGSGGDAIVQGNSLTVKNGGLLLVTDGTTNKLNSVDLNIESGGFLVVDGGASNNAQAEFAGKNAMVAGHLYVESGGTLNLNTAPTDVDGTSVQGTVTLGATSNTQVGGTVTVNSGTLVVDKYAQLHASDSGAIKVVDSASGDGNVSTLKIDSTTLKNFLTGGKEVTTIAATGTTSKDTSESGAVLLSGASSNTEATLEFTDEGTVELSNFNFSGATAASAGNIAVDSTNGATIKGKHLSIAKGLTNTASAAFNNTKLMLVANKLTLGSETADGTAVDYGFSGATVHDLELKTDGSAFTLDNAVTLDVTLGGDTVVDGAEGALTGDFVVTSGGPLTVQHGTYNPEGDITISGGALKVTNAALGQGDANNIDSVLTLGRGSVLTFKGDDGTNASSITVDGANLTDVVTTLDISQAELKYTDGSAKSGTVTAQNRGTIVLTGEQLETLVNTTYTSGTAVAVSGGTFQVVDDLTLTSDQLASAAIASAAAKKFTFDTTAGGTLEVNGTFDITGAELDLGAQANVQAETLKLTNASTSDAGTTYGAVALKSGKYTALKALTSESASTNIQVSGANVYLGAIAGDGTAENPHSALSSTGTIGAKLTVNDANSTVEVAAGRWSATSDITVSAGKLTIGELAEGVAKTDAQGNAITAGLTATKLTLSGGSAKVTSVGSLTVKDLTASGSKALDVAGTVTVSGVYDDNDTKDDATDDTYGVNLASGSVHVGTGAKVTFGEDATDAIKVATTANASGDYLTIADNTFTGKVFTVDAAGEVQFSFDADTVFTKESIAEFRNTLFNYDEAKGVIDGFINLGEAEIKGLAVADDGTVAWDTLSGYTDILADVTTKDLAQAKVTGISDGANVRGNLGSLVTEAGYVGDSILVDGNLTLNNAAGNNGAFASTNTGALLDLEVNAPANVVLNNGGKVGAITFAEGDSSLVVSSNQGTTEIESVDGAEADLSITTGAATIGATTVATLTTAAGTETTFTGAVTVGDKAAASEVSSVAGTTTFKDEAIFAQGVTFAGTTTFDKTAAFEGAVAVNGGTTTVQDEASLEQGATITNGGTFKAGAITLSSTTGTPYVLGVGTEDTTDNTTGTGYLETDSLTLAGNDLVVDPAYGDKTSIAAIKGFDDAVNSDGDAGTVDGRIFVGRNAALDVGTSASLAHMQEFLEHYQGSNGSLVADEVGSVMYLSDKLTVKDGGRIILDSTRGQTELLTNADKQGAYGVNNTDADLYLGKHTVLAIGDGILEDGAAIHFDKTNAGIMAEDGSATIVLDGDKFLNSRSITLFTDKDNSNSGVMVLGDQDIRVETLNGVMYFEYEAGKETTAQTLKLDTYKIDSAYRGATEESRQLLLAYASRTANFAEYYDPDNQALLSGQTPSPAAEGEETPTVKPVDREYLIAGEASRGEAYWDSTNGLTVTSAAAQAGLTADDFHVEEIVDEKTGEVVDHVVYRLAHNEFLEAVARNTDGRALDGAALQGVFGGSAQAALLAARTSQDAIAGRTGVGASSSALTFADNGQGGGVWVAPIYVSQDSDGFAVDTKDYGVDIDLYGVALGGDYTMANGLRLGAFFNVGSGDVDGSGQAAGVSNDFNYYGLGLYAGYNVGAFSLVGDLSYTVVDSDVEASTLVGKLSSSFDTDNFSVGVTGQYQLAFGATTVTPHAGLRFSSISIDDYRIETGYADGGNFDSDSANVFSIPVGVTIAQEFSAGSWQVKPSFDLTLTGNFGDDEIEATTNWDGVANWQSSYNAEFVDNFTYGATLGIAAQSGAFSLGVGISYTGSENVDEFGATANARFTF